MNFAATFRAQTPERTWRDFELPLAPSNFISDDQDFDPTPLPLVSWNEMTGPWYYPIHVRSTWAESDVAWESLNFQFF